MLKRKEHDIEYHHWKILGREEGKKRWSLCRSSLKNCFSKLRDNCCGVLTAMSSETSLLSLQIADLDEQLRVLCYLLRKLPRTQEG